jgi:hypothetical protein
MGTPLGITRTDHTGAELRALSGKYTDGAQVLDRRPRGEAASNPNFAHFLVQITDTAHFLSMT